MDKYELLNEPQKRAVFHVDGPLLILAGAGSGKTRVLTHRAAYLIEEAGVNPYNILAITFTNKAAREMRERIDEIVGFGSESIWVATFHSTCVRILRRYIDRIGYDTNFTIYDTDDQKTVMKDICKRLDIDTKKYKEKMFLGRISSAKDELITAEAYAMNAGHDPVERRVATVYAEYEKELKKNNALDFDDLIIKTVYLLKNDDEVRAYYQNRFRYIMVDEYQDTNTAQFHLVRLLSESHKNLCVVGDDDQSIYKFRGANIGNILNFEKYYPGAAVIKLEENYRSTGNILDAANAVIANNRHRKSKSLWTSKGEGDAIDYKAFDSAFEEADYLAFSIGANVKSGYCRYKDMAVLYRTNAQSRIIEERLVRAGIPYKIVGGVNFYSRKEVKDMLSYLKTVANGADDLAVRRIINVPKRGIGATTIAKVQQYSLDNNISFFDALIDAESIPGIGKSASKLKSFVNFILQLRAKSEFMSIEKILDDIIESTGYVAELEAEETEEAKGRIENIDELVSKVVAYELEEPEATLNGFLEEVALVADIDSLDENSDYVVLMTIHSAKGLEFPYVYLTGMEDGLFPSYMNITSDDSDDLEEERRLCYVGITRAMNHLTLTSARARMVRGETQFASPSRFLKEIPVRLLTNAVAGQKKVEIPSTKAYAAVKNTFKKPAYQSQTYNNKNSYSGGQSVSYGQSANISAPDYTVGDTVSHMKFGTGIVVDMVRGGRDYEVTVDFEKYGVKKMFATFAKLKKL